MAARMDWTDSAAAERAREGNQQAFRVLVERHSRQLFRLAYRMTGKEQDAEDLVQETFLRAYKQIARFDGRSSFATWLYRIATNCSLDLLRSRKARAEVAPEGPGENHNWLEQVAASEPSPERLTHSGQIANLIGPALEKLSPMERAAFILRHYEERGIEEIAAALGVNPNAAKHTVFRAVQKLRRALQPALGVAR